MQSESKFRLTLLLLLASFVAHRAYYNRKFPQRDEDTVETPDRGLAPLLANFFGLSALISTVAYLLSPRRMAWASLPLPGWLRWSGVALAGLGFTVLQWAHRALGRNWSDAPRLVREQSVTTAGPYGQVRHPMYSAFLLILSAPGLIAANWFIGLSWIAMTAADVLSRIRAEEAMMLAKFGDRYAIYSRSTGRLVPPIFGAKHERRGRNNA